MPINPSPRPTDRRAASPKVANDVVNSEHPIVTKTAYNAIVRGDGANENLKIKRLCQVRNLIGQALPLMDALIKDHNPQVVAQSSVMFNALRKVDRDLRRAYLNVPLNIQRS
jgi:hypothetical protein